MSPSSPSRRIRVLLLFGGRSAEHDVSRVTAVAVAKALDPARYEVLPVAITTDGRWLFADEARRMIERGPAALPAALPVEGEPVSDLGDLVARGEHGAELDKDAVRSARGDGGFADRRSRSPTCEGDQRLSTPMWCSRSSTAPTARTAPCRGSWSWPACRTWAPASSARRSGWTR